MHTLLSAEQVHAHSYDEHQQQNKKHGQNSVYAYLDGFIPFDVPDQSGDDQPKKQQEQRSNADEHSRTSA